MCVIPETVPHASHTGSYMLGHNVTFHCDLGHHQVSGDSSLLCGQDGTWEGQPPVCESECSLSLLECNIYDKL